MKSYPVLTSVTPLDDYLLLLDYGNEKRVYDFKPNLDHPFYSSLNDPRLFQCVPVADGEIEWITGQDFCPFTLYEQSVPFVPHA